MRFYRIVRKAWQGEPEETLYSGNTLTSIRREQREAVREGREVEIWEHSSPLPTCQRSGLLHALGSGIISVNWDRVVVHDAQLSVWHPCLDVGLVWGSARLHAVTPPGRHREIEAHRVMVVLEEG